MREDYQGIKVLKKKPTENRDFKGSQIGTTSANSKETDGIIVNVKTNIFEFFDIWPSGKPWPSFINLQGLSWL